MPTKRYSTEQIVSKLRQAEVELSWRRNRARRQEEAGTGSRLLHYFSTTRVDSRGLRWSPVDSTAANSPGPDRPPSSSAGRSPARAAGGA